MITRLRLENFKAWKHVDFQFGQLTGIFGANSSGKSSLSQFLLMLKQTRDTTDSRITLDLGGHNQLVNLGRLEDVLYGQDASLSLSWTLEWTSRLHPWLRRSSSRTTRSRPGRRSLGRRLRLDSSVHLHDSEIKTQRLWYRRGDDAMGVELRGDTYELRDERGVVTSGEDDRDVEYPDSWSPSKGYILRIPPSLRYGIPRGSGRPSEKRLRWFRLSRIAYDYEVLLDGIHYLGPLREPPRRIYRSGGVRPSDVGVRGERTVDALLSATKSGRTLQDGQDRERPFDETISDWLKEMGLVEQFRLDPIPQFNLSRALVKTRVGAVETTLTDVGFGVSQVLPILVLLYYVEPKSTVLLEQPEIHLHPSAQSVLADVFFHAMKTRGIQIIVESHSEHLLRRIQRRRAEGADGSEDVRLYFVSPGRNGSNLDSLELDRYGQIRNWPKDFFGDELGEVFAIQEAGLRRRMEEAS